MAALETMSDGQFGVYALDILRRELGLASFARFLRVYKAGSGDYTRDRHQWLGKESVASISHQLGLKQNQ